MSLVVPDVSELLMLQYIVNKAAQENQVLKLYKNDLTPSDSTVIGNLTESTEAGYAAVTLVGATWTTTQSLGVSTAAYSERTFTFTTAANVYGYYVVGASSGTLLWVERFSGAPFQLPNSGGEISVTPQITLD